MRAISPVIGIPRALAYYTYYPLWQAFLETLGARVIVSEPTNKEILEGGIRETVNDACIPIKVFHGHVLNLKDRVDFLFVPRFIRAGGGSTFCPKFLGLPDMVRYSGMKLPPLLDLRVNFRSVPAGLRRFLQALAQKIGRGNLFLRQHAVKKAMRAYRVYQALLLSGLTPRQAMKWIGSGLHAAPCAAANPGADGLTVALLGYPYTLYDPFISGNMLRRLGDMGVKVITPEHVSPRDLRRASRRLPQNFFWHYSNRVAWSGLHLLGAGAVDGVIHVTAFGCGPDAMVDKFLELEAKQAKVPFITITIDEHSGQGGLETRLEAFVDMLKAKKENAAPGGD